MANLRAKTSDTKVFIFSGLLDLERKDLAKKVTHLGAKYLDLKDFKSFCTHIVTNKLTKSEKVLGGLATGKWILHPDYIHQSYVAGCWLDEEQYEFCDERIMRLFPQVDEQLFFAPRRWRFVLGSHNSAFTGWKVAVIAGAKKAMVIKRLLISGGAEVYNIQLPIKRPEKVANTIAYVFVSEQNSGAVTSLIDYGILCLRPEYIGDYLIKDPPPDIMDYVTTGQKGNDAETPDNDSFLMSTQTTCLSHTSTPDRHTYRPSNIPIPSPSLIDSGNKDNHKPGSSCSSVPKTSGTLDVEIKGKAAENIITKNAKREPRKSIRLKTQEGKGSPAWKSLISRSRPSVNTDSINNGDKHSKTDDASTVATHPARPITNKSGLTKSTKSGGESLNSDKDAHGDLMSNKSARNASNLNCVQGHSTNKSVSKNDVVSAPNHPEGIVKTSTDFTDVTHETDNKKETNGIKLDSNSKQSRKSVRLKALDGNSPIWKTLIPRSKTLVMNEEKATQLKNLEGIQDPTVPIDVIHDIDYNVMEIETGSTQSRNSGNLPVRKTPIPRSKTPVTNEERETQSKKHSIIGKFESQNKKGQALFSPITNFFKPVDHKKVPIVLVKDIEDEVSKAHAGSSQTKVDNSGDARDKMEIHDEALATSTPLEKVNKDSKSEGLKDGLQKTENARRMDGNKVRAKKRLRTGAQAGTEDKETGLPLPPLNAAIQTMTSDQTSSMKQWYGKFKDGYKKLVKGYEVSKGDHKTTMDKSPSNKQKTESDVEVNGEKGDYTLGNDKNEKRAATKRKIVDNLREVLLDLKRKKVSASEWVPIDYVYNQRENEVTEESSMCLKGTSTEIIHCLLEEGYVMSALHQLKDTISFRCVPQAKTLYLLLFQILLNARSEIEANAAYDVFMYVLRLHPPITPELQRLYLEMISLKLEEEALVLNEWLLILDILYCVMQVEDSQTKRNNGLVWKVIKCMIQQNMQHFLLQNAGKITDHGTRPMIMKIFWSPSYHVVFNSRCRQLLDAVLETIILYRAQTDVQKKSELLGCFGRKCHAPSHWNLLKTISLELLADMMWLISMIAETARLSESNIRDGIHSLTLETTSIFVHEISKRLIEADLNEPSLLNCILSMIQLPWLCVGICQQILNTLDDYLLTDEQYLDMKIMSLTQIVKWYIFLLPRFQHDFGSRMMSMSNSRQNKTERSRCVNQSNKENHVDNGNMLKKAHKKNAKGETPLHTACIKNDVTSLKSLLKVPGIDINVTDNAGWTPLHEACNHGHIECVQELLRFVPSKTVDVYFTQVVTKRANVVAVNPEGITPLHDAVLNDQLEVCRLLLHHGGPKLLTLKTCLGYTALDFANNEEMYQMLKSFCQTRPRPSDSQDSSLIGSQGSQESCTSYSLPCDELYTEVLHHEGQKTFANIKYILQYIHLITALLQNYIKATRLLTVVEHLNTKLTNERSSVSDQNSFSLNPSGGMLGLSVSSEELMSVKEDLHVLRKLSKNIELFQNHLLRLCRPEDSDSVLDELTVLQLFVENIKSVNFKNTS